MIDRDPLRTLLMSNVALLLEGAAPSAIRIGKKDSGWIVGPADNNALGIHIFGESARIQATEVTVMEHSTYVRIGSFDVEIFYLAREMPDMPYEVVPRGRYNAAARGIRDGISARTDAAARGTHVPQMPCPPE